jgi:hypothetical protein
MRGEARGRAFDALASEMASDTLSRGKALRLIGAALVGGVLAYGPRVTAAQGEVCSSASGCCSCAYADRDNPSVITSRKCFPMGTAISRRNCTKKRFGRLIRHCARLCEENRPSGTIFVNQTGTACARRPDRKQAVCGAGKLGRHRCGVEAC